MEFTSPVGEQRYADLASVAATAVIALDFDGTLAPIVDDPARAHIHPDAGQVLGDLAEKVAAIAVVTGRPARQVLDLGGLEEVGDVLAAHGKELYVFGQYGNERWSSSHRTIRGPRPPVGLATFLRELPRALRQAGASEAFVEDKGLAIAVHTRRMADPDGAFDRLLPLLRSLADEHDLALEPGRQVIEVRDGGMDKGLALDKLVEDLGAHGVLFAGDDLGDVEAFESVEAWGKNGLATLRVCSASGEESALVTMADVVVHGPDGVLDLLRQLVRDARG
ncbi:MAG: trehalose-phosphatase [Nocardioides sp.]|uniref:trehalose-phosphatase n=1 Tax=Nocardioides sp. TaxID=35761 RepID=UPI0039E2BC88